MPLGSSPFDSITAAARRLAGEIPFFPAADEPARLERAQGLATGIAERLRGACAHLPDEEFAALIVDVAMVVVRDQQRERDGVWRVLGYRALERGG